MAHGDSSYSLADLSRVDGKSGTGCAVCLKVEGQLAVLNCLCLKQMSRLNMRGDTLHHTINNNTMIVEPLLATCDWGEVKI